ncbi:MAG: hypothetical protein JWQ49_897 [Edaphobacter sp.]|nr:hypothetical protein [Edaphobacter sp.]
MSFSLGKVDRCRRSMLLQVTSGWGPKAGRSCTLRTAIYPAIARLGDVQNNSRDVAQPGRAHPWGG